MTYEHGQLDSRLCPNGSSARVHSLNDVEKYWEKHRRGMRQPFFGRFGEEFGLSRMHPTCIIIRQGLGYFHHSEHTEVLFRFGTARPYRFGCQLILSGKSAVLEQRPDLHLLWLQDRCEWKPSSCEVTFVAVHVSHALKT